MDEINDILEEKPTYTTRQFAPNIKTSYLRQVRFLQYASESLIQQLATVMNRIEVSAGDRIVEKGEPGDTMYFVVDGTVRVHDGNIDIATLSKSATFGEIAALSPQRRTASITAEQNCLLYSVNQKNLYRVLKEQPDASRSIIQALCDHESVLVKNIIERTVKVKVLERELEIGQDIQQNFLPKDTLQIEGWEIENYFKAAHEVAGDFFDFFEIKSLNRFAIVIGDVCDTGVGAALFMSLFRSLIRSSALSYDYKDNNASDINKNKQLIIKENEVLTHTLHLVNQYVATTHAKDSMFATIFFALIDPETGEFSYINAGHEAPYIVSTEGTTRKLEISGPVVGLFEQAQFGVKNAKISTGEVLLCATDGLTKARNEMNNELEEERVTKAIKHARSNENDTLATLSTTVEDFIGDTKQNDDITILAVNRLQTELP